MNNLRRIDLNLLLALHALLLEKHVSRAALRLHKSQPAVSHALAHLRRILDDPLLVRRSGGFELTPRAAALLPTLTDTLGQLDALLDPPQFDPARTQRLFRLAMSDYGARILLPDLVRKLRSRAPAIALNVTQASREAMLAEVLDGEIDMVLGVFPGQIADELRMHTLFVENFACLADAKSLPEHGMLGMESWLARPHVLVAMRSGADNEIDHALSFQGLKRRVAVTLPHWGVANDLISGTDLILTVARRSLEGIDHDRRVKIFTPPVEIKSFDFQLVWHKRRDADVAHCWFRDLIAQAITTDRHACNTARTKTNSHMDST